MTSTLTATTPTTTKTVQTNAFNSVTRDLTKSNALGKDQFLKLLITQIQYQDPMSPQSNESMVAQLAQFSALEAAQNSQTTAQGVQAYSLIGKLVVAVDPVTQEQTSGIVSGVKLSSGVYTLIMPAAQQNTIPSDEVLTAFNSSRLSFDQYKNALFTAASLNSDTLVWNDNITSVTAVANALGYSSATDLPAAISGLYGKVAMTNVALANINYVYNQ